ncbi:hypothetical protein I4U23_005613 [Adineta vaga]|nr:hypothetical protein I4U23_005613 [Adineta vaga]
MLFIVIIYSLYYLFVYLVFARNCPNEQLSDRANDLVSKCPASKCPRATVQRPTVLRATDRLPIEMPIQSKLSLETLPVEFVYRILNQLDILTICWSLQCVCKRLNTILDTYQRYKVYLNLLKE